jgi:5-methylcytosine-specific restriction endonuclease McrA
MNSDAGYFGSNVVSCCSRCNKSKKTLDPRTFVLRCVHIHAVFTNTDGIYADLWTEKTPVSYPQYKWAAKRRKYDFEMTKEQYLDLIDSPCTYCRRAITDTNKSGIDRRDSAKGYINGNMNPCCGECNFMKGSSTPGEFQEMVMRVASNAYTVLEKIPGDIPQCLDSLTQFRTM